MSDMVLRVAMSIQKTVGNAWGNLDWNDVPEPARDQFLRMARNAIEALRDPPPNMVYADDNQPSLNPTPIRVWRAMIDAALSPTDG